MSGDAAQPTCGCEPRLIYLWDGDLYFGELTDDERQDLVEFLRAHDIDPMSVPASNQIAIRARCDGSDWLELWRTPGGDLARAPICDYCDTCAVQERLLIPLVELPPPLHGAKVYGVSER
ncbi:hypothetical protein I0C86_41425 [Plantactinospora sp. S1510]|uniref:Uncharacterized protein n=1 Tax=Plantactinospora alkalitolerans TaxID=2789879 RepID=A0ABS0HAE9_9ACTN|nr:hypothetical protein [Plantactinospora alkalitolerans]MBF9135314.1 hypothetical protein [Plantactinospora alkalitolerans]